MAPQQQPPYEEDPFSTEDATADHDFSADPRMDQGDVEDEHWEGGVGAEDDFGAVAGAEDQTVNTAPSPGGGRLGWLFAILGLVIVAGGGGFVWHMMNKPTSPASTQIAQAPTRALNADIPGPVKIDSHGVSPISATPPAPEASAMPTVPMVAEAPAPAAPAVAAPPANMASQAPAHAAVPSVPQAAPAEAAVSQPAAEPAASVATPIPSAQGQQAQGQADAQTLHRLETLEQTVGMMQEQIRRSEAASQATDSTLKQVVTLISDLRQKTQQHAPASARLAALRPAPQMSASPVPASRPRVAVSAPVPPEQRSVAGRWVLRAATPTAAWVAPANSPGKLYRVAPGESLSGIGKVEAIRVIDGRWVVVGGQGLIQ